MVDAAPLKPSDYSGAGAATSCWHKLVELRLLHEVVDIRPQPPPAMKAGSFGGSDAAGRKAVFSANTRSYSTRRAPSASKKTSPDRAQPANIQHN